MLKKLSNREKILLIVLAVALVFYIYFRLILLPIIDGMEESKNNINKYNQEINSQALNLLTNEKDKKQLNELKSNIEKSLITLPQEERDAELAYNIKAFSEYTNVSLSNVTFGEGAEYKLEKAPKTSDVLMSIPVTLQISGEYKNILDFLKRLESSSRISVVNTAAFSGINSGIQASISINYLYMPGKNNKDLRYDFNNGFYGKDDLFK